MKNLNRIISKYSFLIFFFFVLLILSGVFLSFKFSRLQTRGRAQESEPTSTPDPTAPLISPNVSPKPASFYISEIQAHLNNSNDVKVFNRSTSRENNMEFDALYSDEIKVRVYVLPVNGLRQKLHYSSSLINVTDREREEYHSDGNSSNSYFEIDLGKAILGQLKEAATGTSLNLNITVRDVSEDSMNYNTIPQKMKIRINLNNSSCLDMVSRSWYRDNNLKTLNDKKNNRWGLCDTACCSYDSQCPDPLNQQCTLSNGECLSGTACEPRKFIEMKFDEFTFTVEKKYKSLDINSLLYAGVSYREANIEDPPSPSQSIPTWKRYFQKISVSTESFTFAPLTLFINKDKDHYYESPDAKVDLYAWAVAKTTPLSSNDRPIVVCAKSSKKSYSLNRIKGNENENTLGDWQDCSNDQTMADFLKENPPELP